MVTADPAFVNRIASLGFDVDLLLRIAEAPMSATRVNSATVALGEDPLGSGDFYLVTVIERNDGNRILVNGWRIRADLAARVGTDSPLFVLQEFVQEIGEVIEVGNQRNRFIFAETIPIPDANRVNIRELAKVVGPQSGTYHQTFELSPRKVVGGGVVADVRYAYAISEERYLEWLREAQPEPTAYERIFISYGEPDAGFALKLRDELTSYGVDCWLYQLDATDGRRSWEEITEEIHQRDKTIIVCSAKALVREGSLKEIETIVDHDPNKIICVSMDELWKQDGFLVQRAGRDLKPHLMERNYSDFTHQRHFGDRARKLVKALEKH